MKIDKLTLGKHDNAKVDLKQLEMGKKIEMEHTNDKAMAARIAKDHLVEIPDYYTRLHKMETEGKKSLDQKKVAALLRGIMGF